MQSKRKFPVLWRRCVQCPTVEPACPTSCPSGQECILQPANCDTCASKVCVGTGSLSDEPSSSKKASTPAIAGGVAGGVLFIIIVTFLVWWFFIRNRRQEWDDQAWSETDRSIQGVEKRDSSGPKRDARESTRSMGSIASSARTSRASNVIQIAYIPGVTNRSPTHPPVMLAPPVPPVPIPTATSSGAASPNPESDSRSLMLNGTQGLTNLAADGRQSLSPSLATDHFYPGTAEYAAQPAQQARRAKAAVVTVNKSVSNTPPDGGTPADSASPSLSSNSRGLMSSPIVARNVTARPIQVTKSNSGKQTMMPTLANLQAVRANNRVNAQAESAEGQSELEVDDGTRLVSSGLPPRHESTDQTMVDDTPAIKQSQYTDASSVASSISELPDRRPPPLQINGHLASRFSFSPPSTAAPNTGRRHHKSGSIGSLIEEATTRAAWEPSHGGLGSISENHSHSSSHPLSDSLRNDSRNQGRSNSSSLSGPFSDAHEVLEANPWSGSGSGSRGL